MISLALYNAKGGVGKTSAAVNLSYLASLEGKRIIIWDLDPQASTTFYYRTKPKIKGGIKNVIGRKHHLVSYIKQTPYENIHILPADFSTRKLDILFSHKKKPKRQLKDLTYGVPQDFEILFIDSPPGFSLLSENIFRAVDFILLPLIPTTLSIRSYLQIIKYHEDKNLNWKKILPFFTLVDIRKKVHRETVEVYKQQDNFFLKTYIPYSVDVEKMGIHCAPLLTFTKHSKASQAYKNLWQEIKERIYRANVAPVARRASF
jgi:cellulose biosynthesis protein BcsQ